MNWLLLESQYTIEYHQLKCDILQYILYIQSTPDKSDSQGTGKNVRLSEMSDLSEIQNIMQIIHEMGRAS